MPVFSDEVPIFESLVMALIDVSVKGLATAVNLLTVFLDGFIINDSKWRYRELLNNRPFIEALHKSTMEYVGWW